MTRDILDEFEQQRRGPQYPQVAAEKGLLAEDRSSGFCGDVVSHDARSVTLRDRDGRTRQFLFKPGGFLLEGKPVTLVPPVPDGAPRQREMTASGSVRAESGQRARVAAASRIWVEGRHDAELVEHVWGDDLRELGIVVEPMHGLDHVVQMVAEFQPGPTRRLGILVDHLVAGSKEDRLAAGAGPGCVGDRAPVRRRVGRSVASGDGPGRVAAGATRCAVERRDVCGLG